MAKEKPEAAINHWAEQDKINEAEAGGVVWMDKRTGWKIKLRRMCDWNAEWQRALTTIRSRPQNIDLSKRSAEKGYVETAADKKLTDDSAREAFAAGCVVRWNVVDRDGNPMAATPENGLVVFTKFPHLWTGCVTFANSGANFGEPDFDVSSEEGNDLAAKN